jgi:aminoglycoside phosphotransferase (APT) family kinase protein
MPGPVGRDLGLTRKQLAEWLPGRIVDAADGSVVEGSVRVGELFGPEATGFSSDTLMFDVAWRESGGRERSLGLVARIHPEGELLFPEYDLPMQFAILRALDATNVPVPKAWWEEWSGDFVGQPFYLMQRIDGRIPPDNPPYNAAGWVTELSSDARRDMWHSYVETLVAIHRLDPVSLGLSSLAKPDLGATPLEQELAYYENFFRLAYGDREHPTVSRSLPWLRANMPRTALGPVLAWGDARVGNMIFRENRCVAVLDWEMARLADPMMDLAWGLFLERYHTEGTGVERLAGFPDRDGTIALYEDLSGTRTENLEYYELLAGMRFSVILIRLAQQMIARGFLPGDTEFEWNNPVSNLHAKQLAQCGIA